MINGYKGLGGGAPPPLYRTVPSPWDYGCSPLGIMPTMSKFMIAAAATPAYPLSAPKTLCAHVSPYRLSVLHPIRLPATAPIPALQTPRVCVSTAARSMLPQARNLPKATPISQLPNGNSLRILATLLSQSGPPVNPIQIPNPINSSQ